MKEQLLITEPNLTDNSPNIVFSCPEESQFYAQCLEKMVFHYNTPVHTIVEFGTGDGLPVISCLLNTFFTGTVHGFELNPNACELARLSILQNRLDSQYIIHNRCFFEDSQKLNADCLIANPPYLPAPDNDLYIPALHGGVDGASVTKELLSLGYESVLLMISAYSNPIDVVNYANAQGYQISDFMISPLKFGYYSRQPKVLQTIANLRQRNQAFYSKNIYFLAGVLFKLHAQPNSDLSNEFIKVMTAL
ncbi:MAG TPA: SAM-dependent methyltransferase [Stenomitos sp.]